MGRFLRSIFVVFGVMCILINEGVVIDGLGAARGGRVVVIAFGFGMQWLSVGFIALLQSPFFPTRRAEAAAMGQAVGTDGAPKADGSRAALRILFGLLQLYPGASALLIGLANSDAKDARPLFVLGTIILLSAATFIYCGLRRLLGENSRHSPGRRRRRVFNC